MSQSERRTVKSGSPFEVRYGFSRAVRVGDRIVVAGTAPIAAPGDPIPASAYEQTRRCFEIIEAALAELGAGLEHVVRTRMYLLHEEDADQVGRAHLEAFGDAAPAATMIVVAALLHTAWRVEVEAEAIVD